MGSLPVVGKAHEAGAGAGFTWFIYASSLDRAAFGSWAAQHGYAMPDFAAAFPARLEGFRLSFDVESRFWGGAVASLAEDPTGTVEGLALPLPGSARGLVDHKEGAISGLYAPFPVQVTALEGGQVLPALAYRASPDRKLAHDAAPSRRFLETLIAGARASGLSAAYVSRLQAQLASAR